MILIEVAICFFLLIILCSHHHTSVAACSSTRTAATGFAGGFGGKIKSTTGKSNKKKSKGKRKRDEAMSEIETMSTPPTTFDNEEHQPEVKLDKWGLPPPTEDDVFPQLIPGTELIPASTTGSNLDDIIRALKDHIPLDLSRFDSSCVEENCSSDGQQPMKIQLMHVSPPVLQIDNFFEAQECEMAKAVTEKGLDASMEVESATFSALSFTKRTSTSWFCFYEQMPALLAKAHHILGIPYKQMEEPQVVRYRTGEEFTWHYDEVPPPQLDNGGQRVATLLVYLNDVERGGGTIFRDLKGSDGNVLKIQPRRGRALLFFPAFYKDGRPDDRTLHKGEVAMDQKWIAQMWIHQREYTPVVPPGNSHEAATKGIQKVAKALGYIV